MTTTASTGSTAAKPAEHAHKPQQDKARPEADKAGQASDLFSAMLALMSDAQGDASAADEALDTHKKEADANALDPLGAMLAWMKRDPASDADGQARAGTPGAAAGTATQAPREGGIGIDGMARVDEPAPPLANPSAQARAASRPAFSPLNPHAPVPAASAADGQASGGGPQPLAWQRGGPVGSTDALQQQQAAQLAQVRTTVAMNERLGLASPSPERGAVALAPSEFASTQNAFNMAGGNAAGVKTGPVSGMAATGDSNTAGLVGVGAANDGSGGSGGASGDASAQAQGNDAQNPYAAEAETSTVSHWGTQHLRHASLRVGGEGSADAIDIQLQLQGQEVQVNFQTDNAEARAQLRESAGESLADLMQRGGIQLGSVSVGSQGPSHGDGSQAHAATAQMPRAAQRQPSPPQAVSREPIEHTRADGSRPLDVFA
ncbi:flagellar hook-length control protein FliK [Hydrogenophaga sp. BPS33]|uniref:flagellar hook-length control protein FliK n=1 Tax=Hydrogenophaga sp. BPS33 TaxID=2651974 RepID=UPI00131F9823|nr:flagellar hook-length control protein FliK [Hydrogenophaga sp. BPS33]QHE88102.1 flagellar hook-length control protein FliK [Hydrogenophaga sp. BPS33]